MNIIKTILSIIIPIFLLAHCSSPKKLNTATKEVRYKKHIIDFDSIPKLTFQQKLVDYDSLVSYIKQVSPIIYFNKEVRKIDFDKHTKSLRAQITSRTSMHQYLNIIKRTINVAQDGHTSLVWNNLAKMIKNEWVPNGTEIVGYDSIAFKYTKIYDNYFKTAFSTKLNLELIYTNGEYYNLLPFSYNGEKFPTSLKLISCNNQNIHQLVKGMTELISPLRWDREMNRVYFEKFYKSPFIYKQDSLHLIFLDSKKKEYKLSVGIKDTVTFLKEKKIDFGYNSSDSIITHYFENEHIFYAKLPQMQIQLGDSINNRLKSIIYDNKVDAIVLDIRGNGGGDDNTYSKFLKHILSDTLRVDYKLGRNFSSINRKLYEINKDTILNTPMFSFKLSDAATLSNSKMFYINLPNYNIVTPDSVQYPFNGNIYILQDRFIYSSATNLSNLAKRSEKLISIGEYTNLLGGLQTATTILCLPYSKVLFRVEPQIDFSNTKTKVDVFHNNVEHLVKYSNDFLYERTTTSDDVFGKNFLLTKDPMFKKVLDLEGN